MREGTGSPPETAVRPGMQAEDLTRIKWLSDPQVSPDGRLVAFVVTTLSRERDEYLSNIWTVETAPGGAGPRRFTTGPRRDTTPRWSPDGRWLAFVSDREPGEPGEPGGPAVTGKTGPRPAGRGPVAQLYAIPAAGGEPRRLTDLPGGVRDPVWAPDGRRLVCVSRTGPGVAPEAEPGKSRPARVITSLKYRSDNEGFVYDRRSHLFLVPFAPDGAPGGPHQVTDGDWEDADPAWAPPATRGATRTTPPTSGCWTRPPRAPCRGASPGRAARSSSRSSPRTAPGWPTWGTPSPGRAGAICASTRSRPPRLPRPPRLLRRRSA